MLDNRALLVSLTVRTWSATVIDKKTARNAESDAGADQGTVRARKLLVPAEAVKPITTAVGVLRSTLYDNTAPWSDTGWRILPTDRWQDFNDAFALAKGKFAETVQEFLARYPADVGDAYRRMGALFDRSAYPTVSHLATRFGCSVDYSPIPNAGHVVVDLGAEDNARVRDSVQASTAEKFEGALLAAATDLKARMLSFQTALNKEGGRVHDSVPDNIVRTAQLLKGLNVYANPDISALCASIVGTVNGGDTADLRKNTSYRQATADQLGRMAHRVGELFPGALFS